MVDAKVNELYTRRVYKWKDKIKKSMLRLYLRYFQKGFISCIIHPIYIYIYSISLSKNVCSIKNKYDLDPILKYLEVGNS